MRRSFTEWANVARAESMFRGHYQSYVPADLGFYDPRVPETRRVQADMARGHRVEAFVHSVKLAPEDLAHRTMFARARKRSLQRAQPGSLTPRTRSLAMRTARLRAWAPWKPAGLRALQEGQRRRARRVFVACFPILPGEPT